MKPFIIAVGRWLWLNDFISVDIYASLFLHGNSIKDIDKSHEIKWSWVMWRN